MALAAGGVVYVLDPATRAVQETYRAGDGAAQPVWSIAASAEGDALVFAVDGAGVELWERGAEEAQGQADRGAVAGSGP